MQATANHQEMSAVDALWTIYQQQSQRVREAFVSRIIAQDEYTGMPIVRSREEMMEVSKQRMRDIIDGHEQTLGHDEAMRLVDQAIAEAV